jgi:hypothetical protein
MKGNEVGRSLEGGMRLEATAYTYRLYVVTRRNWNRSRLNAYFKSVLAGRRQGRGLPPPYETERTIGGFAIVVEVK